MPTIEIVVPGSERLLPIKNATLPFYIRQNRKIKSHRALFKEFLKNKTGVILHLGNKDLGRSGCFWGSDLIDWDFENKTIYLPDFSQGETGANQSEMYKYKNEMFVFVVNIIKTAIKYSPEKYCYYFTDMQFGSDNANFYNDKVDIASFCKMHADTGLYWNTLYQIY